MSQVLTDVLLCSQRRRDPQFAYTVVYVWLDVTCLPLSQSVALQKNKVSRSVPLTTLFLAAAVKI